jgi:mannonate dehydratase
MAFEQTWRWFGPDDPITLEEIRQAGATGVVTALHQIPVGAVWPEDAIMERKRTIAAGRLTWSVAESLPVHDDIKRRSGRYREWIENYKSSIRNLGRCGIGVVCYNFMPVLDWSRTDLEVGFADGSTTTKFEAAVFAVFDLHILRRPHAELSYNHDEIREAERVYSHFGQAEKNALTRTILLGFPGSGEAYTLDGLLADLKTYENLTEETIRENLRLFLREIVPAAEEADVLMAIHPDDPPWSLLGLPRIVSTENDLRQIIGAIDSPSNGIAFCAGSLGASAGNDIVGMAERFAHRVNFVHLRNVKRTGRRDFLEDNHLDGDVDMYGVMTAFLREQQARNQSGRKDSRMPMRPDHGHLMQVDRHRKGVYPGYSLFGRMRGLSELRGMEAAIMRALDLQ